MGYVSIWVLVVFCRTLCNSCGVCNLIGGLFGCVCILLLLAMVLLVGSILAILV